MLVESGEYISLFYIQTIKVQDNLGIRSLTLENHASKFYKHILDSFQEFTEHQISLRLEQY